MSASMVPHSHPTQNTGFSLVEVLIALIVLSVGLLGIAVMMSTSLKANDSSYMRTQATEDAYSIIDKMRANSVGAMNGAYNIASTISLTTAPTGCYSSSSNPVTCTPTQLAQYDLYQWAQKLNGATSIATGLPNGQGSITSGLVNGFYTVTVTVAWSDTRAQQALSASTTSAPSAATTSSLSVSSVL